MKTCLIHRALIAKLVVVSIFAFLASSGLAAKKEKANEVNVQDGVIVQKVGASYVFVFPSTQGRVKATANPVGTIKVGNTITLMYALKIIGGGKTRFIGLDAVQAAHVKPKLQVEHAKEETFGFLIKDTLQPQLDIFIEPSFMKEKDKDVTGLPKDEFREKAARQGNLNVVLGHKNGKLVIIKAVMD